MKKLGQRLAIWITAAAFVYASVRVAPPAGDLLTRAWGSSPFLGAMVMGGMVWALPIVVAGFLIIYAVVERMLERLGLVGRKISTGMNAATASRQER